MDLIWELLQISDDYGEDLQISGSPDWLELRDHQGNIITDGSIEDIERRLCGIIRELGAAHELTEL